MAEQKSSSALAASLHGAAAALRGVPGAGAVTRPAPDIAAAPRETEPARGRAATVRRTAKDPGTTAPPSKE
ncbi:MULTISPECIES: hypothetical protein [Streptomyces]|uniref:hypothetical protein n=1 Tax=Streptomyces TaxID=1883 RepID=UPI00083543F6|nr:MULTISPECIES: hypothetical protein [Streptomyces]MDN5383269.1 hypothetical protein [Streptomyces sp. LB8]